MGTLPPNQSNQNVSLIILINFYEQRYVPLSIQIHSHRRYRYTLPYSGVGKSCVVQQFVEQKINEEHDVTIGV